MCSEQYKCLQEVLETFDRCTERFTELDVRYAVQVLRKEDDASEPSLEWLAEAIAFDFEEAYQDKDTGWGTYFGPMIVWRNENGTVTKSPSIKRVTPEMLDYWAKRVSETNHPILKARYADLVWDFCKTVTGKPASVDMAWAAIDAIVEIAQRNCHKHEVDVITKLRRALSLAASVNDTKRIETVRDTTIAFEDKVAVDDKPGLWGFSYDILWQHKKVTLTDEQKRKIISNLEERLEHVSNPFEESKFNPWAAQTAAIRLAKHYRRQNQQEDVKRVLLKYGTAFERMAEPAAAMLATIWLQQVHSVYLEYGLKEEANRIAVKLRELGPKANSEMQPFAHTVEISKDEMNQYVEAMTAGESEIVLARIAVHYIPRRDKAEKQIRELSKDSPTVFLLPRRIQNHKGRPIAFIGSVMDDIDGHVVLQISQNMQLDGIFLRPVMDALIKKFSLSEQQLVDYLYQSPLFEEEKKLIIEAGLQTYLNNDYLIAVHLLIPQVEAAVRNLVEKTGGVVLKPARNGGFDLKTFHDLLIDERMAQVFGEDITLYFQVLFTDPRGWNLRNDVCHGIIPAISFDASAADRVVHALLCLALAREQEDSETAS